MYYKKKKERKNKIVLLLTLLALILVCLLISMKQERYLTMPEKVIKDSVLFIDKIICSPFKWIENSLTETSEKKDLYKKYKELEQQLATMELTIARKEELEKMVKEYEKTLGLNKNLSDNEYLNASVINRNIGYWYNTITIDKGSKNGLKPDMAVIVPEGLIGKISKVSNYNSTVKLLTTGDINNKISVKIKIDDEYVYGLLSSFNQKNKTFIVEGIADNKNILIGSLVTTTGLGNIFPSGIIIGKVKSIKTDNFDLAKILEVESNANFDNLTVVTVLKREGSN